LSKNNSINIISLVFNSVLVHTSVQRYVINKQQDPRNHGHENDLLMEQLEIFALVINFWIAEALLFYFFDNIVITFLKKKLKVIVYH